MNIKYEFMAAGITQAELAAEVAQRMRVDGLTMTCDRSCISTVFAKAKKGIPMTDKEQRVHGYLLHLWEDLVNKEKNI